MNTRKSLILSSILAVAALGLAAIPCDAGQPKGGGGGAPGGAIPGASLAGQNPALGALLDKLPREQGMYIGPDWNDSAPVFQQIMQGGKANIQALVGMIVDNTQIRPNQMEDYKVRWALHGCVVLAAKSDDKDRKAMADILLSTINDQQGKFVQAYIIQEIMWCGSAEHAPALAKYLSDEILYDYALRAMTAFGPDSLPTIRAALPTAKGRIRLALVQTLGTMRDAKSVADIAKLAADNDADTRIAVYDALGNIGDASASTVLLNAVAKAEKNSWEHTKACEDSLQLAQRLVETGDTASAAKVYQALATSPATADDHHVQIAAVQGAALAKGDIASLMEALKSPDFQVRESVLQTIATTPGPAATKVVCDLLAAATTPTDRVNFLNILAKRKDPTAATAILAQLRDQDDQIRTTAANTLAAVGGAQATSALLAMLNSGQAKDQQLASSALKNLEGKEGDAAIAAAATKATDAGVKANLISVLGAHRAADQSATITAAMTDKDAQVRGAAIRAMGSIATEKELPSLVSVLTTSKDGNDVTAAEEALKSACGRNLGDKVAEAVAPSAATAVAPNGASVVRVLGAAGGPKALAAVSTAAKSGQGDVKNAAIRTLADWRSKDAAAPLLQAAMTAEGDLKIIAIRGLTRMAGDRTLTAEEKTTILSGAIKVATRPEEKREILGAMGNAPSAGTLQAAAASIDDDAVREEACLAVVRIAEQVAKTTPAAVLTPLGKVAEATKNNDTRNRAQRIMQQAGGKK
jgi:HEAT repeat protein